VVAGDSVSDLSRLAYQTSAFSMFASSPLFGIGMGQFAFRAIEFMPSWAYFSPEVAASMIQPNAPWPNTYSLYARISAETGLLGLIAWLFLWTWLVVSLLRAGGAYARRFGAMPIPIYPLVMNCVAVLVSAITTDTFRTPMIWIALGGSVAVLSAIRDKMADEARTPVPAAKPGLS
jgi:O-antigen ligase